MSPGSWALSPAHRHRHRHPGLCSEGTVGPGAQQVAWTSLSEGTNWSGAWQTPLLPAVATRERQPAANTGVGFAVGVIQVTP